jgi:ankyrin repeat protein
MESTACEYLRLRNIFNARLNMVAVACCVLAPTGHRNLSFERRSGCQYSRRPREVSSTESHFTAFSKICRTPLHSAIDNIYECARRLLDNGADIMQQAMDGGSPLHIICTEVSMKICLNYKENIDFWLQNQHGMTILHYIAWNRRQSPLNILPHSHQNHSGLSCLETKDNSGRSMLHWAAECSDLDLVACLLASPYAATMSMPDDDGNSLLHYAIWGGKLEIIDLLLDANFEMDAVNAQGETVLHEAARCNRLQAARRLIERGASYQLAYKDCDGRTPLEVAQRNIGTKWTKEAKEMAEYLQSIVQERNGDETPQLECTEVEGTAPEIESTTPPLHRSQVSMVIVALVLIVSFQSFLLWRQDSVGLPLGSSEL